MSTTTTKKTLRTKGSSPSLKETIVFTGQDKVIQDLIYAPSKEIDAIALHFIIKETGYIVEYLKQKINLEQRYMEEHANINNKLYECCPPNKANGVQRSFMDYVGLTETLQPFREEYIAKLKQQREELLKFRVEQQKAYEKNKAWMNQSNQEYIIARLKKLPAVQEIYFQKWDEIERSAGTTVASPMVATPMTPTLPTPLPSAGSAFPLLHKKLSQDEEMDTRAMSMDDDRVKQQPVKFADLINTSPSSPPQHQSSRIERFMKKHLNKPEDAGSKNIRIAKLKVEVGEADTNYRNVVREISTLSVKIDATNHHILNNVQIALKEKSERVKALLQVAMKAELDRMQQLQQPVASLLAGVEKVDTDAEAQFFNQSSNKALNKFPKPTPIYYQNHHVGVCKDLIFGTSLTEYAQQRGRSPPLLITKCIEAIENMGGLEKEGIYRVSGKQSNIEKIKHAFELDEEAVVIGENDVPEDLYGLASVIKIFLRELKTPLFPFKLTDRLVYSQIPDAELRLMNLLTRIIKLEPANYDTLKTLIHHLSKLQACVEKNKMTANNLTLIFTPAIFQDLNHAQSAPGEWAKDCVLEDLIMNSQDIFANKDLHNNSAITGHIQYGFDQSATPDRHHSLNRYAMQVQSPNSPTGTAHHHHDDDTDGYSIIDDDDDTDYVMSIADDESSSNANSMLHSSLERMPDRHSSRANTPTPPPPTEAVEVVSAPPPPVHDGETPARTASFERKKFQAHFQGKGLKVDTGNTLPISDSRDGRDVHIPTVKSATVPSYDWLQFDPENTNTPPVPAVPKLRRSATTGKKVISRRKMSLHHQDGTVPDVPILKRGGNNSTSTTTIP